MSELKKYHLLDIEPKAIPPVVEAPLFFKTIISFLSFIFSVKKLISLSDWLSPGATLESALRRPKLNSSLPHIHRMVKAIVAVGNINRKGTIPVQIAVCLFSL